MAQTSATVIGKRCQCSACGEYFSTTANFDRHRKGAYGVGRVCVDPSVAGLVVRQSGANSFWCMPGQVEEPMQAGDHGQR